MLQQHNLFYPDYNRVYMHVRIYTNTNTGAHSHKLNSKIKACIIGAGKYVFITQKPGY